MSAPQPLAERMRPRGLEEWIGQEHLLRPGGAVEVILRTQRVPSALLWGPPGCGKTSLARALAGVQPGTRFVQLSAVDSGARELRETVSAARDHWNLGRRPTLLFVDEIHRWNKAQQDALLPHVEDGTLTFVGATTENPSFSINRTLLSRMELITLHPLPQEALVALLRRALDDPERGLGARALTAEDDALRQLARLGAGDARLALGMLERVAAGLPPGGQIRAAEVLSRVGDEARLHLDEDEHFALASALIKSMRGSDPHASVYWLARLLESGEDPRFIARRLIIFASEDVGNAEPRGLELAVSAAQAVQLVGMPEARINLAQAVTFLATAPKSNAAYAAIGRALDLVRARGALPVPLHLRNADHSTARAQGHGVGYRYPHDHPFGYVQQRYLPEAIEGARLYEPVAWGAEKTIGERMRWLEGLKPGGEGG